MTAPQPVPAESPPARWPRRKYLLLVALAVGLPALLLTGSWVVVRIVEDRQLRDAFAEADRLDPGWHMSDIEARRAVLPDGENGALQVLAARKLLPSPWPVWPLDRAMDDPARFHVPVRVANAPEWPVAQAKDDPALAQRLRQELDTSFQELSPPTDLNAVQVAALRAELRRAEPALARARQLAALPNGRYTIQWRRDFISTLYPHLQQARDVANLLAYDALLRAHDGDDDEALRSCRAALNAGRSIGDEPTLIAQLVRVACRAVALRKAERVLAQGQPSDAALAAAQRALEQEAEEPLLLYALRGERAGWDGLLSAIQSGEFSFTQVRALMRGGAAVRGQSLGLDDVPLLLALGSVRSQRARLLRYLNQAVEAAKLPPEEQQQELERQEQGLKRETRFFVRMLAPAPFNVAQAVNRTRAELRCAAVALAVERYRRKYGRWPQALAALVPAFLPRVPTDPFDGKPLRLGRFQQGVVVYSVGLDRVDNGGNVVPDKSHQPGVDLGFRLWDVARRRQPAPKPESAPAP